MIKLFGFSPAAYRIPNLVFGVLSVLFLYLLGRDVLRSRRIGFFSAFFYMLCGLSLSQARLCTIDAPSAFFMILSFYCFYKYFSGAWHWLPSLSCTAVAIGLSIAGEVDFCIRDGNAGFPVLVAGAC
ncbi:MAG: phospholipid carrier-dependent glycosyltransferase [Planctomycetota bacterium]|nr:phospholipid carrier-dependent glycosyltransferase [Planctomycetota bacterium]